MEHGIGFESSPRLIGVVGVGCHLQAIHNLLVKVRPIFIGNPRYAVDKQMATSTEVGVQELAMQAELGANLSNAKTNFKTAYEILSLFYDEENERYEALNKRAAAYIALIGAFSVFTVLKLDALAPAIMTSPVALVTGFGAGLLSLLALAAVAWSQRVQPYRTPTDSPLGFIENLIKYRESEEDIYARLAMGLAKATETNRSINANRAKWLARALWTALAAALLVAATNAVIYHLAYLNGGQSNAKQQYSDGGLFGRQTTNGTRSGAVHPAKPASF
ncbi:MAG: hypothetical protein V4864_04010 [Pseudomonadota bacterium]